VVSLPPSTVKKSRRGDHFGPGDLPERAAAGVGAKDMEIVRAKPDETATLTHIAFSAKRHWGYSEKWMEVWREVLTIQPEFVASHETYVAMVDARIVGFYALARNDGKMDLAHLWVLPDAMSQGIGRSLFVHAAARTRALGFRYLEIESDPNAEGFYQRMGAQRVGVRRSEFEGQRRELPCCAIRLMTESRKLEPRNTRNSRKGDLL
jgi:GNAT superfamily N-acetyltransferase